MIEINKILSDLEPISLKEMDAVKLMNRTDTKFAFNINHLASILEKCKPNYRVLEIKENRLATYKTLYFDTKNHTLFLDHHNEVGYRYKIRIRNYVESNLFFLEIKKKIKGRTDKNRIKLDKFYEEFTSEQNQFITESTGDNLDLIPTLWNNFSRITLVNKNIPERITLDLGLSFTNKNKTFPFEKVVIAEVKQERINLHSPFIQILKLFGIRETSLSKYCVGSLYCYKGLKYNNFKEKLLKIEKINKAA
jgi:hypothetical protein